MADVVSTIGDGLWNAFLMAWEVWWGPGLRIRDLGCDPGLRPPTSNRGGPLGGRPGAGGEGHGAGRRLVVVLLRGDRHRQVAVPEGRVGHVGARLPVRLHQPRVGAGAGALDSDRLA